MDLDLSELEKAPSTDIGRRTAHVSMVEREKQLAKREKRMANKKPLKEYEDKGWNPWTTFHVDKHGRMMAAVFARRVKVSSIRMIHTY